MLTTARAEVVTAPATEPVTIHEAKRHVELATSDSQHDTELNQAIEDARQQWERDTGRYLISRAMKVRVPYFGEYCFGHRHVTAIDSVTYFDLSNVSQTLASSVYELDTADDRFLLAYDQDWPSTLDRWDAVTINYTLGSHADSTTVPAVDKRAILLLVGYYFRGNKGDDDRAHDQKAYERLVAKNVRSSYP